MKLPQMGRIERCWHDGRYVEKEKSLIVANMGQGVTARAATKQYRRAELRMVIADISAHRLVESTFYVSIRPDRFC